MKLTKVELFGNTERKTTLYNNVYRAGVWTSPGYGPVFGLVYYSEGTHMCYGLDYFSPAEVTRNARDKGHDKFYFDAGGNGSPIWCTIDELERVFRELDLLPKEHPNG